MAKKQIVQTLSSLTSGKAPQSSDIENGELAMNNADGRLFIKKGTDIATFINNVEVGNLFDDKLTTATIDCGTY